MRAAVLSMFAVFAVLCASACATGPTTSVTQVWKADMSPEAPMRRMLVIGTNMSDENRRTVEDAFVKALAKRGVEAKQSYLFFDGPSPPPADRARAATRKAGFDGLLALVLKGAREKTEIVPGQYTGDFWGGVYGSGAWTYEPARIETDETIIFEVTLWDPRAQEALAWSAQTETGDLKSNREFAKSVADKVLPQLEASRFIPPKT